MQDLSRDCNARQVEQTNGAKNFSTNPEIFNAGPVPCVLSETGKANKRDDEPYYGRGSFNAGPVPLVQSGTGKANKRDGDLF